MRNETRSATSGIDAMSGIEMVERTEPRFVKFGEGEVVEGILLAVDRVEVGDPTRPNAPKKPVIKFTVEIERGELVSFLGSYDLVTKLRMEDRGHYVSIRYEGEDKTISRNGNAMKRFNVKVSRAPIKSGAELTGLPVTVDELGF